MRIRSKSLLKHSLIALGVSATLTACGGGGGGSNGESVTISEPTTYQTMALNAVQLKNATTSNWGNTQVAIIGEKELSAVELENLKTALQSAPYDRYEAGYRISGTDNARIAVKENPYNDDLIVAYAGKPVDVKLNELSGKFEYRGKMLSRSSYDMSGSADGQPISDNKTSPITSNNFNVLVDFDKNTVHLESDDIDANRIRIVKGFNINPAITAHIKQVGKYITFEGTKEEYIPANAAADIYGAYDYIPPSASLSGGLNVSAKLQGKFAGEQAQAMVGSLQIESKGNISAQYHSHHGNARATAKMTGVFHATKQ